MAPALEPHNIISDILSLPGSLHHVPRQLTSLEHVNSAGWDHRELGGWGYCIDTVWRGVFYSRKMASWGVWAKVSAQGPWCLSLSLLESSPL